MSDQFERGEGLTHQTTWQDIAHGYRHIFERLMPHLTRVIGEKATDLITGMIGEVDAEAKLLAKNETNIKDAVQELRELASALDTDLPSGAGYVERRTAIADALETLY